MRTRISTEEAIKSLDGSKYELIEVCPELEFYKEYVGTRVMISAECRFKEMGRERRENARMLGLKTFIFSTCYKDNPRCYVIRDKTKQNE